MINGLGANPDTWIFFVGVGQVSSDFLKKWSYNITNTINPFNLRPIMQRSLLYYVNGAVQFDKS